MRATRLMQVVRCRDVIALVAAVSFAALGASSIMTGCSSDAVETAPVDSGTAQRDATLPPPAETCIPEAPVTTRYAYKSPAVALGSCSEADLAAIIAHVDATPNESFPALFEYTKKTFSAVCNACMFNDANAAAWAPVLTVDGAPRSLNGSGCIELVSGKGAACGGAHRNWQQCILEACTACDDASEAAMKECTARVQSGACAAQSQALQGACGNQATFNGYLERCTGKFGFDQWVRVQCVSGGGDAGIRDAGADG